MGELTSSMERVAASSSFAASKASEMSSGISSFVSDVNGFLTGGWRGQASEAFQPPFNDWTENAKKVEQALRTMAELLGDAAREYSRQEDGNQALLHNAAVSHVTVNL